MGEAAVGWARFVRATGTGPHLSFEGGFFYLVALALASFDVALAMLNETNGAINALETVIARALSIFAEAVIPARIRAANSLASLSNPSGSAVALSISANAVARTVARTRDAVACRSGPARKALNIYAII